MDFICANTFKGNPCKSLLIEMVEDSACSEGDPGSIPGLERSTGEEKGYPLMYSGLKNPMDCIVHGVIKSQT